MLDNSFLSVRKGSPFLQHAQTTWMAQMGCRERTGYPTDSQDAGLCASKGKKKRAVISGHGGDQITPVAAPAPQLSPPCLQWHHLARASPAVCRGSGTMELPDRQRPHTSDTCQLCWCPNSWKIKSPQGTLRVASFYTWGRWPQRCHPVCGRARAQGLSWAHCLLSHQK